MAALYTQHRAITALLQASFAFRLAALMLDRRQPDLAAALEALRRERDTALAVQHVAGLAERQAGQCQKRLLSLPVGSRQDGTRGVKRKGLPFHATATEVASRDRSDHAGTMMRRRPHLPRRKSPQSPNQPLPGA